MPAADTALLGLKHLFHPEVIADPYPFYRQLRLEDPVHEDADGAGWIVSRYDDVSTILVDHRFSAARLLKRRQAGDFAEPLQKALARADALS